MVKNTIDTLYMTYNIYCNYCGIFLSPARKIMSTCQMIVYMQDNYVDYVDKLQI